MPTTLSMALSKVSTTSVPLAGAVQTYQTVAEVGAPTVVVASGPSSVASTLLPLSVPPPGASTVAPAKSSLAGGAAAAVPASASPDRTTSMAATVLRSIL